MQLRAFAILVSWALVAATVHAATDTGAVLDKERSELSDLCTDIEFLDGYTRPVNVNDDGLDDLLIDYGALSCDGMRSMFCGSGGCTQKIYLQRSDGSFYEAASFLTYEIDFDEPENASFVVASHGSSCDRAGVDACYDRFSLASGELIALTPEQAPAELPANRWTYRIEPRPLAAIGPEDAWLELACVDGAVRLSYADAWLYMDGAPGAIVAAAEAGETIMPTFSAAGSETILGVRQMKGEAKLASIESFPLKAAILDAMARGDRLTVSHSSNGEQLDLIFSLAGSAAAITQLRQACM